MGESWCTGVMVIGMRVIDKSSLLSFEWNRDSQGQRYNSRTLASSVKVCLHLYNVQCDPGTGYGMIPLT